MQERNKLAKYFTPTCSLSSNHMSQPLQTFINRRILTCNSVVPFKRALDQLLSTCHWGQSLTTIYVDINVCPKKGRASALFAVI